MVGGIAFKSTGIALQSRDPTWLLRAPSQCLTHAALGTFPAAMTLRCDEERTLEFFWHKQQFCL